MIFELQGKTGSILVVVAGCPWDKVTVKYVLHRQGHDKSSEIEVK